MDYSEIAYWNYRLVKKIIAEEEQVGVHEVYYNKNDIPVYCSVNPRRVIGDNLSEAQHQVELMLRACKKPILDFKIFEKTGKDEESGE